RILALSDEAVEAIQTAKDRQMLRLGTTVTLALSLVPRALSGFAARHPEIQIHISCDRSDALLAQLETDDIDIAFMMDQGKQPGRRFVHSQPLVWVSGAGFDAAAHQAVPLAFLADGRDLRHYAFAALDGAGRQGNIAHLSQHPIGVRAFVQSGLAVTVMPRSTVAPPLQILDDASGLPPLSSVALSAYHQIGKADEPVEFLLTLLEEAAR
ncbi:MAG: LysR substrate-binding domain-containing protein, partial [Pseudomonadota bacterium]